MNQFLALLKEHQTEFEKYYGSRLRLNQDIRRAMSDMLHCKNDSTRYTQWYYTLTCILLFQVDDMILSKSSFLKVIKLTYSMSFH